MHILSKRTLPGTNFLFNQRNNRPQMAPIDDSESPLHTTTLSGSDGAKLHWGHCTKWNQLFLFPVLKFRKHDFESNYGRNHICDYSTTFIAFHDNNAFRQTPISKKEWTSQHITAFTCIKGKCPNLFQHFSQNLSKLLQTNINSGIGISTPKLKSLDIVPRIGLWIGFPR